MAEFTGVRHFDGQRNLSHGHGPQNRLLGALLDGDLRDVVDIVTALQNLADKLDLDAGVSDTDYRALLDTDLASVPRNTIV